jgi:hypothetical protein
MVDTGLIQSVRVGALSLQPVLVDEVHVDLLTVRRVYDVRVQNLGDVTELACVHAVSTPISRDPVDEIVGRGRLAKDATVDFLGAVEVVLPVTAPSYETGLDWQPAPADECPTTPNVVVILADDLGYADVSSYGGLLPETQAIDRLGAEGIRFTSFYAAPTCTPARAELDDRLIRSARERAQLLRPLQCDRDASRRDHAGRAGGITWLSECTRRQVASGQPTGI